MKIVTSITVWNDAVGKRMSITYSEIDNDGKIVSDNKRIDRVLTNADALTAATILAQHAQTFID